MIIYQEHLLSKGEMDWKKESFAILVMVEDTDDKKCSYMNSINCNDNINNRNIANEITSTKSHIDIVCTVDFPIQNSNCNIASKSMVDVALKEFNG